MLRIRFFRTGKKNQPFFRIVVTDKRNPPRGGRFLELLGFFNPLTKEKQLKAERIKYWLSKGAQPSDRVHNLLVGEGIIKENKKPVHSKAKKKEEGKSEPKAEKPAEPAKAAVSPAVEAEAVPAPDKDAKSEAKQPAKKEPPAAPEPTEKSAESPADSQTDKKEK